MADLIVVGLWLCVLLLLWVVYRKRKAKQSKYCDEDTIRRNRKIWFLSQMK